MCRDLVRCSCCDPAGRRARYAARKGAPVRSYQRVTPGPVLPVDAEPARVRVPGLVGVTVPGEVVTARGIDMGRLRELDLGAWEAVTLAAERRRLGLPAQGRI